jgi:hypothetical protein
LGRGDRGRTRQDDRVLKINVAIAAALMLATVLTASPALAAAAPGTPPGSFWTEVINRDSAKCMNVRHGSSTETEAIQEYHCDHTPAAKFLFRDMGEDPAVREWYEIENQNSRYCVTPQSWGGNQPDPLAQYGCTGSANEQWTLAWEPNGFYRVINRETDKCLSTGWNRADWTQLVEEPCAAGFADQDWSLRLG